MLDVDDLSKTYGETRALDGATIGFAPGTIHAILGENGSGKSTLVKLLSGVVSPTRGEIRIDGRPVANFSPAAFQSLGLVTVFQEVLIAPDRTTTDNILLGCDAPFHRRIPRRARQARAERALARIARTPIDLDLPAGLQPLAVQQLVVLARALMREPRVLILDEATAALDYADREAVFTTVEDFARNGGQIIFISHRMDEVMRLAHRVSILRSGKLVETLDRASVTSEQLLKLMAPAAAEELVGGH